MNQKEKEAVEFFQSGLNCAQSVLLTYSEKLEIAQKLAVSIACGFGAGMGRLQETCGAVTGSFMVISVYNCQKYSDNNARKENTYKMIQDFNEKFKSLHGTTNCRELINCDLNTEEGRQFAKANRLFENVCEKCVSDSVMILENLIK
jgi:C_GCAxxG_C_C family probable redox protein